MKKILAFLVLFFYFAITKAQSNNTGSISVKIKDEKENAIENATVELLKSKDSSLVKVALSDKNGVADFNQIPFGTYLIKGTSVNYSARFSAVFRISVTQPVTEVSALSLIQKTGNLKEVIVENKKPFIQKLSDRIVVNVDNSIISAGSSAMDVLERSPGVNVDQNDVISLRGKQGVIIMIDGKNTPMTGTDLANYLKGLPSEAIDRIDIITNPSAKYDAAGNSGIIDIHMKKDQRLGLNGSLNA
jgi:iron complex outermembrane receptor protein